jgi:hypothetical protein
MYNDDYLNFEDENDNVSEYDIQKMLEKEKMKDRGYNVIYRKINRHDGIKYNKKFKIYTSGGIGSYIRDVETGKYFSNIVGSRDEDLFFKVILATGQCNSSNGFSTLFFISPQHYESYLQCEVDPMIVRNWEKKRDIRLTELKKSKRSIYAFER